MTSEPSQNHLWQRLWEYDPNGLIVVDPDLYIRLVNPAFCRMFQVKQDDVIGQQAIVFLENVEDFQEVWRQNRVIQGKFQEYPRYNLCVSQVIFSIEEEGVIACIMSDLTHALMQRRELQKFKQETIKQVNEVVDHQMKVVQEIAGLLGETTAETKVSLLKIIQMLEKDSLLFTYGDR
jgi:PAS domain S-box-containing protein